jgi:hypothetical protein
MLPYDITGAIPIERMSGISAKIISFTKEVKFQLDLKDGDSATILGIKMDADNRTGLGRTRRFLVSFYSKN